MKKLLLTGVADAAVKLNNKEIRGEWCRTTNDDLMDFMFFPKWQNQDCGAGILSIDMDRIKGQEYSCKYTAIKTWYDPTIPTATRTPTGALVSTIKMTCSTLDNCTWRQRVTVHLGKGYLHYKTNWSSFNKKCPDENE